MGDQEKIVLLDILAILREHTDETHRLTQTEIKQMLEAQYGTTIPRSTVKDNIEKLLRYSENHNANEILKEENERVMVNKKTGEKETVIYHTDFGFLHDFTHRFDTISHYRIDRMSNIQPLETKCKPLSKIKGHEHGLNLSQHMAEHIYMFTGDPVSATLRFHKHVLNEFVDWFGTANIHFSDQKDDEVTARVTVNEIAMRKWALQYALHVKVLSPKSLVDGIKEDLKRAMEKYEL